MLKQYTNLRVLMWFAEAYPKEAICEKTLVTGGIVDTAQPAGLFESVVKRSGFFRVFGDDVLLLPHKHRSPEASMQFAWREKASAVAYRPHREVRADEVG